MAKIVKKYIIKVPASNVWKALTRPSVITKWGAGPAKMSSREGAEFKLWGGEIYGENTHVVPEKRLVQNWYGGDWDEPSIVTINIKALKTQTNIELIHTNVPKDEAKSFATGWDDYYFGPIKEFLESKYSF